MQLHNNFKTKILYYLTKNVFDSKLDSSANISNFSSNHHYFYSISFLKLSTNIDFEQQISSNMTKTYVNVTIIEMI